MTRSEPLVNDLKSNIIENEKLLSWIFYLRPSNEAIKVEWTLFLH